MAVSNHWNSGYDAEWSWFDECEEWSEEQWLLVREEFGLPEPGIATPLHEDWARYYLPEPGEKKMEDKESLEDQEMMEKMLGKPCSLKLNAHYEFLSKSLVSGRFWRWSNRLDWCQN